MSNSGETEEIIKILPWIKRMDIPTIIITGGADSTIAACGDVVLKVDVDEACPYNVVPTSSTTATLALGDAIAIALMEKRAFKIEDFASLHPGGTLGRKLFLKVEDLMHTGSAIPKIYGDSFHEGCSYRDDLEKARHCRCLQQERRTPWVNNAMVIYEGPSRNTTEVFSIKRPLI